MDRLRQDLRFAVRGLRRNPAFTAIALLTVALGIGLNTAIFSVVNGVLLDALPYPEPDRLLTVWENHELRGGPTNEWTGRTTFANWRERNRTFAGMAAVTGWQPNITGGERPDVLAGALVSPSYFSVLGVEPAIGRGFTPDEETPGNDRVVVLSHELWQERFGGDPGVVGSTITLNGEPDVVVGVAPPGLRGPIVSGARIWGVLPIDRTRDDRGNYYLRVIGRLAPGATREAALSDMRRVAAGIAEEDPVDYRDVGITLEPLQQTVVGAVRTPLLILLATVGLVLLIACANVANLLLARASVRERELAVRASLGAGRGRIVRQLLTESVSLALVGGALGLGLGVWGTEALVRLAPPGLPRADEIGLDPTVFAFALGASLLTGLLFGLAPALAGVGRASASTLREGDRGSSSPGGRGLRGALVVGELALGVAVLVAAGLLLRSFGELRSVDPGFRTDDALAGQVIFTGDSYRDVSVLPGLVRRLEERLEAAPGVRAAGAASLLPLAGNVSDVSFGVEGRLPEPGDEPAADYWQATPGFFEAMRIPLLRGRTLDDGDGDGALPVVVVSQSLVDAHFADEDPIGKRIRVGGVRDPDSPWRTIVGVVGTVHTRGLSTTPRPEIYLPYAQLPSRVLAFVLHTDGADPAAYAPVLRGAVESVDADLPVSGISTLDDVFAGSIAPERFVSTLLAMFAALALLLAAIGIYGVMAFMVSRRTREIGIRIALGARPRDVLADVMARGATLTALGVAIGLAAALAAGRAVSSLLFGVEPTDPLTLGAVVVLLGASALFACFWPARRATRVDPIITLRAE